MNGISRIPWRALGCVLGLAAALVVFSLQCHAAEPDLTKLSLEQLLNINVTTVSRHVQKRNAAPAAVAVISGNELRHSGVTALPDALKLVPGLYVGRLDSSQWEVSSRGFSGLNSSKLLVLMDGRSLYTPLFSGVFWDVQDTDLHDVDRIEVIRGPGATVWGANAMNGVINIITKSPKQTQGVYADAGGGNEDRAFGTFRYGGKSGTHSYYRVYGKFFDRASEYPANAPNTDEWRMGRFGFRNDWKINPRDTLIFQGDAYAGYVGDITPSLTLTGISSPASPLITHVGGGNLMSKWKRHLANGSMELKAYYDRTHRNDPAFIDDLDTYDVDFQHRVHFPLGHSSSQDLTWDLSYREWVDDFRGKGGFTGILAPQRSYDSQYGGYVQDTLSFPWHRLALTFGSKLEHNSFSGFEIEPSARFALSPADGQTFWGAVSRAARIPTRIERDLDVFASVPAQGIDFTLQGNPDLESEKLTAYELGYRLPVSRDAFVDLATFYNRYSDLITLEEGGTYSGPAGVTVIPVQDQNTMTANSYGAELSTSYKPLAGRWRITANYTYFDMRLFQARTDLSHENLYAGATPMHQVGLIGFYQINDRADISAFARYVGALTSTTDTPSGAGMPAYFSLDSRIMYRLNRSLSLAIVGQNLLQDHHLEYPSGVPIERAGYAQLSAEY